MPLFSPFQDNIQVVLKTLTDAQIKTLPSAAVDIVAAQGANKVIIPVSVFCVLNNSAGGYTNLGTTTTAGWQLSGNDSIDLSSIAEVSTILANPGSYALNLLIPKAKVGGATYTGEITCISSALSDRSNLALQLVDFWTDGGNYTGGNAANTLKVYTYYAVVSL